MSLVRHIARKKKKADAINWCWKMNDWREISLTTKKNCETNQSEMDLSTTVRQLLLVICSSGETEKSSWSLTSRGTLRAIHRKYNRPSNMKCNVIVDCAIYHHAQKLRITVNGHWSSANGGRWKINWQDDGKHHQLINV